MRLVFRVHAVERMFQHDVDEENIRHVVEDDETIKEYPDDTPYPSRLILGWRASRPIHVVAADDAENERTFIVTVYEPDFRRKRA